MATKIQEFTLLSMYLMEMSPNAAEKLNKSGQQFLLWQHNKSDQAGYEPAIRKKIRPNLRC